MAVDFDNPACRKMAMPLARPLLFALLVGVLPTLLPVAAFGQNPWPFNLLNPPPSPDVHGLPQPLAADGHAVTLPPDADPAYSTPVDLDGQVDTARTTRRAVADPTGQPAGTLTINTRLKKLYLSMGDGRAMEYSIAVGREGFAWKGEAEIGRKAYWPGWTPPPEMLARSPELPPHLDGSLSNPLGARALYLFQDKKDTLFRIHGTNEPKSIGHAVSSGCIRMLNADVIDLYGRVTKGTKVVVL